MNNPDSHSMYWYDTPDLISSVGTHAGAARRGHLDQRHGSLRRRGQHVHRRPRKPSSAATSSLSYGSYNTNKQAVHVSSGLMGGHWTVDARLTHIGSDGYIRPRSHGPQILHVPGRLLQRQHDAQADFVRRQGQNGTSPTTGATKEEMRLNGRRFHTAAACTTPRTDRTPIII